MSHAQPRIPARWAAITIAPCRPSQDRPQEDDHYTHHNTHLPARGASPLKSRQVRQPRFSLTPSRALASQICQTRADGQSTFSRVSVTARASPYFLERAAMRERGSVSVLSAQPASSSSLARKDGITTPLSTALQKLQSLGLSLPLPFGPFPCRQGQLGRSLSHCLINTSLI